ncbi:hypothetical protein ACT8ZV_01755 [Nocardioides sp. MAHUQ-72]|uniref:hypothetical protein n=1 Tax=unclassified Nocardioides TaxID=2615069 RepID=UPI0036165E58
MSRLERVDVAASYARRDDEGVHLVLLLPDLETGSGPVVVRLRDGERTVRRPAVVSTDADGVRLELVLPAAKLGRGVWRLAVRTAPDAPFTRIEARLLTGRKQPVALLPGPTPATRMPAPEPAPKHTGRPAAARRSRSVPVRRGRRLVTRLGRAATSLAGPRDRSHDEERP